MNCSYEDMDAKMTYLYLRNMVKDFGYPPRSIVEILFNTPEVELENGLRPLRTNSDVSSKVKEADVFGNIEVYIIHKQSDEHDSDASDDSASQSDVESEVGSIDNVSDEELLEVRHMRVEMKKCKQNLDENGEGASQIAADDINGEGTSAPPDVVLSEETEHTGYDSEYGEDGDYSPAESDEEDEAVEPEVCRKKKKSWPTFNTKTNMFTIELALGMRFTSKDEFKDYLRDYGVTNGYPIKFIKNESNRVTAICGERCKWRCHASPMQVECSWQIKSLNDLHECNRDFNAKFCNVRWLSKKYKTQIIVNPRWKLDDFVASILHTYAINVSVNQCSRAKKFALGERDSIMIDHYAKAPSTAAPSTASPSATTPPLSAPTSMAVPPPSAPTSTAAPPPSAPTSTTAPPPSAPTSTTAPPPSTPTSTTAPPPSTPTSTSAPSNAHPSTIAPPRSKTKPKSRSKNDMVPTMTEPSNPIVASQSASSTPRGQQPKGKAVILATSPAKNTRSSTALTETQASAAPKGKQPKGKAMILDTSPAKTAPKAPKASTIKTSAAPTGTEALATPKAPTRKAASTPAVILDSGPSKNTRSTKTLGIKPQGIGLMLTYVTRFGDLIVAREVTRMDAGAIRGTL
ncbi:hypothetical protein IFM89_033379 [Coptis chinensis]|uniref:Transposase MuDR plant domain-containing protein n=1 Tax=Coptis chinensis TaxID=261450 RepID=A0A835LPN9_9MAGN|nr:hypothetical protein IFM89_033379 [Coptis chinensis]